MKIYFIVHAYDFGSGHPETDVDAYKTPEVALKEFGKIIGMPPLTPEDLEGDGVPEFSMDDEGNWTSDPDVESIDEWVRLEVVDL